MSTAAQNSESMKRKRLLSVPFKVSDDAEKVARWNKTSVNLILQHVADKYAKSALQIKCPQVLRAGESVWVHPDWADRKGVVYITDPERLAGFVHRDVLSIVTEFRPSGDGGAAAGSAAGQVGDAASSQVAVLQKVLAGTAVDFTVAAFWNFSSKFWHMDSTEARLVKLDLTQRSADVLEPFQSGVIEKLNQMQFSQATTGKIEDHRPRPGTEESEFCDPNQHHQLCAGEWVRVEINMSQPGLHWLPYAAYTGDQTDDEPALFHGTPLGAVIMMCLSGGFIPGPGVCGKGRKAGAFCTPNFYGAYDKGQSHMLRYALQYANNKVMNALCMPTVIELRRQCWADPPTRLHGSKFVFEGKIGKLLPGVRVAAVHINKQLWHNFQNVWHLALAGKLADPEARLCGQNGTLFSGDFYQSSCGTLLTESTKAHVSNTKIWYCHHCAKFRCGAFARMVRYSPENTGQLTADEAAVQACGS